ncbi:sugar transferase [Jeotgalibacillus salarius]|uniref:Sugar transferase n=1 Tax=Jeotgalibacillus salarius TaxID=546023 RepID=A0A4Y8LFZ4_9BACL|nr:sugar transferase [Jeotgalibacillus salarius]TFE01692.1 sugar transferase [Jeotgalibacillus salarius]
MKRIFDVILSFFLLILLSPLYVILTILIYLIMGRPIYFKQHRPGLKGKPFVILKFRTMKNAVDENFIPLSDKERLTKLGVFLRKYSLDEMPQIVNVLRGDMSFVGPRPLLMDYLPLYTMEQMKRHEVRPGITGWAQVNGRNGLSWERKFQKDIWYVENKSFLLDLKILALTVNKVLIKEGITQPNHPTTEKFTGSKEVI